MRLTEVAVLVGVLTTGLRLIQRKVAPRLDVVQDHFIAHDLQQLLQPPLDCLCIPLQNSLQVLDNTFNVALPLSVQGSQDICRTQVEKSKHQQILREVTSVFLVHVLKHQSAGSFFDSLHHLHQPITPIAHF